MLPPLDQTTSSTNMSVSVFIAVAIAGEKSGALAASFWRLAILAVSSHCSSNPATIARARGSSSIRRVWAAIASLPSSWLAAAAAKSASSGIDPHSRYDSRDASSNGESAATGCPPAGGETSVRYRKYGDCSIPVSVTATACASVSPSPRASENSLPSAARSASASGRRNARPPKSRMKVSTQVDSLAPVAVARQGERAPRSAVAAAARVSATVR